MRRLFWLYLVLMGMVMVWLIPPFQKPDEIIHFQTSAVIAGGRSGSIARRYVELPKRLEVSNVIYKYESKFNDKRVWEKDESKNWIDFNYPVTPRSYISYFPVEVGVWLGSLSPYPVVSFYLGRMVGFLLFLFCIWLSIRIIPKNYSGLILAYSIIPMVIHQVSAVSYDVLLLCLAPLALAVFLRVLKTEFFWRWLPVFGLVLTLFVLTKQGYYLILLLLPVVFWARYKNELIDRPWIVSVVIFALIPVVLWFIKFLNSNVGGGDNGLVNGAYQLEIIRRDPLWLGRVIADTWTVQKDFYLRGMIGYFGWFDYEFDLYQYFIVVGLVVAVLTLVISKIKSPRIGWVGLTTIGGIIFGTSLLIGMGMWTQWTTVGSSVIAGVQGRYLLPLMPLLFFWLSQFWVLVGKRRANIVAFGLVFVVLIFGMVEKVNKRYYDFSSNFTNKDELEKQVQTIEKDKKGVTYLSSKKKLTKILHIADGSTLGGFEVAISKWGGDLIRIPYRFSIKDKDCKKEILWGYLDLNKVNNNKKVYQQKVDRLKDGISDICLVIEPIIINDKEKYFDYVFLDGEPMAGLLFVTKEVVEKYKPSVSDELLYISNIGQISPPEMIDLKDEEEPIRGISIFASTYKKVIEGGYRVNVYWSDCTSLIESVDVGKIYDNTYFHVKLAKNLEARNVYCVNVENVSSKDPLILVYSNKKLVYTLLDEEAIRLQEGGTER